MNNRISVIGLGKLGLPLTVALASRDFRVVGVDIDPRVLESIKTRDLQTYEPGLRELLNQNGKWLRVTDNLSSAVILTPATIVIVGTPSDEDGCFSLRHVLPVCQKIGKSLRTVSRYHLIIISSTVNPGDCGGPILNALETASGKKAGSEFGLCYVPEFVALGDVLNGFFEPDFVLIGSDDSKAAAAAADVYKHLCINDPPIKMMNLVNAEIAKIAANCHTVLKTVFANQMAELCEAIPGADVDEVTGAIGMDSRASPEYLKGSTAALGPCLLPNEQVQTVKGLHRIDSLRVGDLVFSHDGRPHPITKIYSRDYVGQMLRITPEGFPGNPLAVTPDHPVWAARRIHYGKRHQFLSTTKKTRLTTAIGYGDTTFLSASDLDVGDLLVLPALSPNKFLPKNIDLECEISPDLMLLFGFYLSEGSSEAYSNRLKFSFHAKETKYVQQVSTIAGCHFDVGAISPCTPSENALFVRIGFPSNAADFFKNTFGCRAENKKVPYSWLGLPEDFLTELLRGIWYGDGSNSGREFTWATVSKSLFNFMKLAFLRLGVAFTTYLYAPRIDKNGTRHQASYFLNVANPKSYEKMNALFPDLAIEYDSIRGKKSVWFDGGKMFYHVKRIESFWHNGRVYNLEVANANSYMTESAIVHNCFARDMKSLPCIAKRHGVELPLIEVADELNYWQVERLAKMVQACWVRMKDPKKIGILGLTYKPGVNVHEPSAGLLLLKKITPIMDVVAYDPAIQVGQSVRTAEVLVELAAIVVVTTPWKVFEKLEFHPGQVVIDCWRCLDQDAVEKAGAEYIAIGRG